MADTTKALDVQKREIKQTDDNERTRDRRTFIPRTDIFETAKDIVVVVDMPGCNDRSIDVTLEKNILKVTGLVEPRVERVPQGYVLSYGEYGVGDYQRSFALSDEIDREHIEASIKNGVLRLVLPKAGAARTHKITVTPR